MITIDIPRYAGDSGEWVLLETFTYYSPRYDKFVTCKEGMFSDGATGAFDIRSKGWWVHDQLCNTGKWGDGTPLTNWECSQVLQDILESEGRYWRARYWFWATFAMGGGEARKNGMFSLKEERK